MDRPFFNNFINEREIREIRVDKTGIRERDKTRKR
jgi:hypothetical protein